MNAASILALVTIHLPHCSTPSPDLDTCSESHLTIMADDDLYNLELLSLVTKISQELINHLNLHDKVFAEFLIALHDESNGSLPAYKAKLQEMEARFSDSFVENINRLILSMHPKYKERKKRSRSERETKEGKKRQRRLPSPRHRSPGLTRGHDDKRVRLDDGYSNLDERPVPHKIHSGKVIGLKDEGPVRSAKRLTSPERWELKQLISSGAIGPSEYPELDEEMNNPAVHTEVEEELDIEIREEEPPFLAGQTKRTLELSPVKIVKAPDGSLNRAALNGASLAKERRELRQQEANEEADSQARDFGQPWLDPMSKDSDKIFAQDMRGNLRSQKAGEVPKWREQSFNKATTFGEITSLSIQDQRKSLPIYKLKSQLLQAIGDVRYPLYV